MSDFISCLKTKLWVIHETKFGSISIFERDPFVIIRWSYFPKVQGIIFEFGSTSIIPIDKKYIMLLKVQFKSHYENYQQKER